MPAFPLKSHPPIPKKRGRPRKSSRKIMKKVSSKGAYTRSVKNQMIIRRAPVVETKQRTSSEIASLNGHLVTTASGTGDPNAVQGYLTEGDLQQPLNWRIVYNDDAFTNIPMDTFCRNMRGLEDYQMIGDSITGKWLNVRVEVRFPQGELIYADPDAGSEISRNIMIQENYKAYLIFGWVTAPLNAPISDPSSDRKVVSVITQTDLQEHIKSQIRPYFNDNIDKLSFTPMQTTNIKIEKYVRLKPNLSGAVPTQAQGQIYNTATQMQTMATGSIPNVQRNHTFKLNRKIHYDKGKVRVPVVDPPELDYENNFPNNSWLPFCVLYTPDWATAAQQSRGTTDPTNRQTWTTTDRQCQHLMYRWNTQMNYTDS